MAICPACRTAAREPSGRASTEPCARLTRRHRKRRASQPRARCWWTVLRRSRLLRRRLQRALQVQWWSDASLHASLLQRPERQLDLGLREVTLEGEQLALCFDLHVP